MWAPPEFDYPDEWADNRRIMPAGSPYPGPWRTDRTPYVRAPMRAFADPSVDVVVVIMRRQRGKSELGLNCLGWMWDTLPGPSLWITPTEKLARSMASDRIDHMFSTVQGLRERTRQRAPGSLERFVGGVRFGIGWAGSRTEVASHPCKYAIVDERSRMTEDAGGEGDPVRIVQGGGGMFPGATTMILSSPTEEGICPTHLWWLQGTRMRWCWQCSACGEWFVPEWSCVAYPHKADYKTVRDEAHVVCPTCETEIRDCDVGGLEADYVPSVLTESGDVELAPGLEVRNSVASFWVTGLSDQITSIGQAAEQYVRAAREGEPGAVQAVTNVVLGELWKVPSQGIKADAVREREVEEIPGDDIQLVTVGVDVQEESLYYVVRGWCAFVTSYLLEWGQVYGDTEFDAVFTDLQRHVEQTYCGVRPAMVLMDSGFRAAHVYEQCRRRANWFPSKGVDRATRPYWSSKLDQSRTGRTLKAGATLWNVATDTWKQWLYDRIRWQRDTPGAWYVPSGIEQEYCDQVTNERAVIRRGKRTWERTGNRRNHLLDCELLAAVAADIQGVRRLRPVERAATPAPAPPKPPTWAQERRERINRSRGADSSPFGSEGL